MSKLRIEIPVGVDYELLEERLAKLIESYTNLRSIKNKVDRALRLKFLLKRSFLQSRIQKWEIAVYCKILNDIHPVFNWFDMFQDILFIIIDHCHICGDKLHQQGIYPTGYPKTLKFCCGCSNLMKNVFLNDRKVSGKYNQDRLKRIEKAITLEVI